MSTNNSDHVSKRTLILAMIGTAIFTVVILNWQGMLRHSEFKDDFALSTYRAIFISEQESAPYRMSPKPSHQSAQCLDGYLFIVADKNEAMQGLIVDYKNRGIKCVLPGQPPKSDNAQP